MSVLIMLKLTAWNNNLVKVNVSNLMNNMVSSKIGLLKLIIFVYFEYLLQNLR